MAIVFFLFYESMLSCSWFLAEHRINNFIRNHDLLNNKNRYSVAVFNVTNDADKAVIVREWFNKYHTGDEPALAPLEGEPRPLYSPINKGRLPLDSLENLTPWQYCNDLSWTTRPGTPTTRRGSSLSPFPRSNQYTLIGYMQQ